MMTLQKLVAILAMPSCLVSPLKAQTNATTNAPTASQTNHQTPTAMARSEEIRAACVEGRRYVCGRVVQIVADGLVVDSGYGDLLKPPFNQSWVVNGSAVVNRDANAIEEKRPDAICTGLVFLTAFPKKPAVKEYDYVALHAYPAGDYKYKPLPGVEKTIRRFSGSLERAIKLNLEAEKKGKE